jgi:proline iminopeptidase
MPERDANTIEHSTTDLFPEIRPHRHGMLGVDDRHTLYWEESGNPDGIPVIFLHGGPGAGTAPNHRRFFDPNAYRILMFDQRGAGRSTPYAETIDNTTDLLIQDLEILRRHFGVEKWLLFGGSWGATLGVAYAVRHTNCCLGLVLRGVFMGRQSELDWFFGGTRTVFPEAWENFVNFLPENERHDVLGAYHQRLMHDAVDTHQPAARAWNAYETACSTLRGARKSTKQTGGGPLLGSASLALARIEAHYFVNGMFLDDDLLVCASGFGELPGMIVQGRYDMVCPMITAHQLQGVWPGARLEIIDDAGHSAMEPGIRCALVAATERFKLDQHFS